MARSSYVETLVGGLDSAIKKAMVGTFDYVLKNLRWGRPGDQVMAENLSAVFLTGTTPAVANTAFSIEHGLGTTPYLLIPVLDLNTVNSEIVPLSVAAVPDARRVYLKSSVASATFYCLVEG